MTTRLLLVPLLLTVPAVAAEPDWPQFRGPNRDGHSPDKGLLKEWPADGPPLAWKAEGVGTGYSSVAVVGDSVLTMGDADDASHVYAVGRADGKPLWHTRSAGPARAGATPAPARPRPSTATRCTPSGRTATSPV